jgi:DNA-binding response OmpR family regulator
MDDTHILVIESTPTLRQQCVNALQEHGYIAYEAASAAAARGLLSQQTFDAVLCNAKLSDDSGMRLLREYYFHFIQQATQVAVLSDSPGMDAVCEELGFEFFPCNPVCLSHLMSFLNTSLRDVEETFAQAGD